jgi:aerobic carbon-monoxide dehydrogenase medium subunit
MKPPSFEYVAPDDLATAVGLLAADDEARALAGGQSLVPMLSFRLAQPTTLVGLQRITELQGIDRTDSGLRIGAMVTQRAALSSQAVREVCPLVQKALLHVGHPQIRARGTVGGTVAHCDPAAELPAALLAVDGAVTVRGPDRSRSIPADELFRSAYTTTLAPGEIITDVYFPAAHERSTAACLEISRRPGDFALIGVACQLTFAGDNTISDARVALFAVADVPLRAASVEGALIGERPTQQACIAAASLIGDDLPGRTADSVTARYRRRVAPVIVKRALAAAMERLT